MRPFLPEPDLSERVHDAVLNAICSGELKSGARITQEELANQFGVSRQPVLQAMMLLRREGFLIDAGRKGVCVAPLGQTSGAQSATPGWSTSATTRPAAIARRQETWRESRSWK